MPDDRPGVIGGTRWGGGGGGGTTSQPDPKEGTIVEEGGERYLIRKGKKLKVSVMGKPGEISYIGGRGGTPAITKSPFTGKLLTQKELKQEEQLYKSAIQREQRIKARGKIGVITRRTIDPTTGEITYHGIKGQRYTFPSETRLTYTGVERHGGIPTRETTVYIKEGEKIKAYSEKAIAERYKKEATKRYLETIGKQPRDIKYYTGRIPERETKVLRYEELTPQQRTQLLYSSIPTALYYKELGLGKYDTRSFRGTDISLHRDYDRYRDSLSSKEKAFYERYEAIGRAELETGAAKRYFRTVASPFIGASKLLYAPTWDKRLKPKIDIGQEKLFKPSEHPLMDVDIQRFLGYS